MLSYSCMVLVTRINSNKDATADSTETEQNDSGFWIVCGNLKRKSKRQVWWDRLARLELKDLQRIATLGVGGFGRYLSWIGLLD